MRIFLSLLFSTIIWLPSIQFFFSIEMKEYKSLNGISAKSELLAAKHLAIWTDHERRKKELENMQKLNPEWDFMSRTYFVLALANMAIRDPQKEEMFCEIIDAIIENTLAVEQKHGHTYFLLGYAQSDNWALYPERSIFIDGEITLMMGARRLIQENHEYKVAMQNRVQVMMERMKYSSVMSAESYPDECWMFCNTVALAAIRMMDALDGSNNSVFLRSWVQMAREKLSHPKTELLISSYSIDGTPAPTGACPEGSTIFMSAHMLELVDPEFATNQYERAKQYLGGSLLGFGFAREWPDSCRGYPDIDSGPIIPFLGASASASGMAILGASAFDDQEYLEQLLRSLSFMGFPMEQNQQLQFQASNPVGDAVLLYALVEGPLWERVWENIHE